MPVHLPHIATTQRAPGRRTMWAYGVIAATLFTLIALGHDGRRLAQMMVLALPALAWLLWPVSSPLVHRLRTGYVWLWVMGFAIDGVVRAYLLDTYQATPNSSFILTAAANTNGRETSEYLSMYWRAMLMGSGVLLIAGLVAWRYAGRGARADTVLPRAMVLLCLVTLLLGSVGYLSKPWRRLHPALFWAQWSESVDAMRAGWADLHQVRSRALARATAAAPTMVQEGPATVVLVHRNIEIECIGRIS